ncbi:hypothetical protein COB21_05195 [Candidatus Aerophobetes bacterium]|uniref:Uncharacterized protein n=1 Tax=Aerophobetes bacterium TaxID=2030807 RepID=A0A2A4X018_UNCAE|nr:MAG: hypothetical protein COB21_05195 [Candidatus Aerophobetes bacterium]
MDSKQYHQSFRQISNHEAWVGNVSLNEAANVLNTSGRDFVISLGMRSNHYILTCKTATKDAVHYGVRYDVSNSGWKNHGAPIFNALDALIESHLEKEVIQLPA